MNLINHGLAKSGVDINPYIERRISNAEINSCFWGNDMFGTRDPWSLNQSAEAGTVGTARELRNALWWAGNHRNPHRK
jgi:hypothetical protein